MLGALRHRTRWIERALAAPFLWLRIPPNAVTLLSLLPAFAAALLVGQRQWGAALGLGMVASWLDFIDGTVAREQHRVTAFGGYLDSVVDRVVDLAFLFGLGFALGSPQGWVVVGLCALGSYGTSYARARVYEFARPDKSVWAHGFERPERLFLLGLGVLVQAVGEWRGLSIDAMFWFLVAYAAASLATFLARVLQVRKLLSIPP